MKKHENEKFEIFEDYLGFFWLHTQNPGRLTGFVFVVVKF